MWPTDIRGYPTLESDGVEQHFIQVTALTINKKTNTSPMEQYNISQYGSAKQLVKQNKRQQKRRLQTRQTIIKQNMMQHYTLQCIEK